MDDDDLRRGRPTNHVKYGEGVAILAGDALLTDSFQLLTRPEVLRSTSPDLLLRCIREIAVAAGSPGMVGGQALDIVSEGHRLDLPTLEFLHIRKTGALIRASVLTGGLAAGADPAQEEALRLYADRLGLAFQIADDILDVVGDTATLGKPVGSDEGRDKATYPALLGMDEAKRRLGELIDEAVDRIKVFGPRGEPLGALARFVASRDY
jgi:geranylgeranyl diphosphate synthase type II